MFATRGSAIPVSPTERVERHGHHPATFLLPGPAVDSAERALFANGFETIILRADSLHRDSLLKVIDLLHSAGFVILADAGILDGELRRDVEEAHKDRTLFDLSGDLEQLSGDELLSKVVTHARSLRLGSLTERGE